MAPSRTPFASRCNGVYSNISLVAGSGYVHLCSLEVTLWLAALTCSWEHSNWNNTHTVNCNIKQGHSLVQAVWLWLTMGKSAAGLLVIGTSRPWAALLSGARVEFACLYCEPMVRTVPYLGPRLDGKPRCCPAGLGGTKWISVSVLQALDRSLVGGSRGKVMVVMRWMPKCVLRLVRTDAALALLMCAARLVCV